MAINAKRPPPIMQASRTGSTLEIPLDWSSKAPVSAVGIMPSDSTLQSMLSHLTYKHSGVSLGIALICFIVLKQHKFHYRYILKLQNTYGGEMNTLLNYNLIIIISNLKYYAC
jgi:hypothetical protein